MSPIDIWPVLNNPPVILSIFQIKFRTKETFDFEKVMEKYDVNFKKILPNLHRGYHSDIGMDGTPAPGISILSAKANTKLTHIEYMSVDLKEKFIIESDNITIVNENKYQSWDVFYEKINDYLSIIHDFLKELVVIRTSIRYVNKFTFEEFNDPFEYFTKAIASEDNLKYGITSSSFRLNEVLPDEKIIIIQNHSLQKIDISKLDYFFDIDVLSHNEFLFEINVLNEIVKEIRKVKNDVFFNTVKEKTLNLCN